MSRGRRLCVLLIYLFSALSPTGGWGAPNQVVPIVVAQITIDDEGQPLKYPSTLFYDAEADELYLVDMGSSRVVVYGPDYFPVASIGEGRGVTSPRGGFLAPDGLLYLCQGPTSTRPARITVLNAAFLVEREIFLEEVPGNPKFVPKQVVVNRAGTIYVVGESSRGALVLDEDGVFLRWLQPTGSIPIWDGTADGGEEALSAADGAGEERERGVRSARENLVEAPGRSLGEGPPIDIPEEFRPRSEEEKEAGTGRKIGPVKVRAITIDSEDNLYLVSSQVGTVYVYAADETLRLSLGKKGGSPGTMSTPNGLAVDEQRSLIYVVDYMRHSILAYDTSGTFLFEFGGRGVGLGWFNYPSDVLVDKHGRVVVADRFNRRVQILEVPLPKAAVNSPTESSPKSSSAAAP